MRILRTIILIPGLAASMIGCDYNSRTEWTLKQREEFETECSRTDTFNNVVFRFQGFADNEFDSILVKEYKDEILLDSFKIFVSADQGHDKERKDRNSTINRTMNIKHEYHFMVPGQKPYELANMKMIMWAQY